MKTISKNIIGLFLVLASINSYSQNPPVQSSNQDEILKVYNQNKEFCYVISEAGEIRKEAMKEIEESAKNRTNSLELESTIKSLEKFPVVKEKAEKEVYKLQNLCIETGLDALEYFEMANDLQFAAYDKVLTEINSDEKMEYIDQANSLFFEARKIYEQAKKKRDLAFESSDDIGTIKQLIEAQKLEELAICKQEIAFSLYLGFSFIENQPYYSKVETCFNKVNSGDIKRVKESNNDSYASIDQENTPVILKDKNSIEVRETENLLIGATIYKVQVGAFMGRVDEKVFKGIQPITVEKSDTGFLKYLVGEYNSMEVARHAQKILRESGFSDAFVVAYENGKRVGPAFEKEQENLAKN